MMQPSAERRTPIERILLATDGSMSARPAEELAETLAKAFEATLALVRVLEFEPWRDLEYQVNQLYLNDRRREIREQLGAAVDAFRARGVSVEQYDPVGVPSQEIIELASRLQSDLVVLGTHGRSGLDHVLIGSTAERVVRGAPCPVATIKAAATSGQAAGSPVGGGSGGTLGRLLVPVDFSDCSQEALEYAVRLGERFGSTLTLLHVVEPVAYGLDFTLSHALTGAALRNQIERAIDDLIGAFSRKGLRADRQIVPGLPADVITRVAEVQGSEAIVMGTHGRRGWSHVRFGSVAESVVRQARCPVFTIRSPKFQPGSPEGRAARAASPVHGAA